MRLYDVNYGSFEVNEPVLVGLIGSKELQRLKRIDQMGTPQEYSTYPSFSRYEHSVGVMLLLRKLGASLEEQVAGLLHDASHVAFCHNIDWALGEGMAGKEDMQEANHRTFLADTHVPRILKRFGMDFDAVSDIKRYRLLESEAPSLCADRVDYALKEFYYWENRNAARKCADDLAVFEGGIVFASKRGAETFGRNYMVLQNKHWAGREAAVQSYILSRLIRHGLEGHAISFEDLKTDDEYVMGKLRASEDPALQRYLKVLALKGVLPRTDKHGGETVTVRKKFRYVDPEYVDGRRLHRLSGTDSSYGQLLRESRSLNQRGVTINLGLDGGLGRSRSTSKA